MTRCILIMLFSFLSGTSYSQSLTYSFKSYKMGTEFNINVYGEDSASILQAVQCAWDKIDSLNAIFSDYSTTSELALLHHDTSGIPFKMSPHFKYIMDLSLKYSKLSSGAFDVSVGALTRLWRRAVKLNDFPEDLKIKEALKHVGYQKIKIRNNCISLPRGLLLDFGAIAKGYAVDKAYEVLRDKGFPRSLVDGGGDIYAGPPPSNQAGWAIATSIKSAQGWKDSIQFVSSASIVTSGDAYKYIEDQHGHRYSHIINPKTGYGIYGPHLTTVIAANATHADALATTLSVLAPPEIKRFKRRWTRAFKNEDSSWTYSIFH